MIRRLTLTNWRAYEHVQLDLGPGTTFVVARNGIGKSSLIEGAAWALYGEAGGRPDGAIRLGAEAASASVEVTLRDGRTLVVTRKLPKRLPKSSKTPASASLAGSQLSDEALDAAIRDEFGADAALLARLTMLRGGERLNAEAATLNLQEHLCRFFGIDGLQDTLAELDAREKLIERRIRGIKQVAGVSTKRLDELRERHHEAIRLAAVAETVHQQASDAETMAARANSEAETFAAWQLAERDRQSALDALSKEIAAALSSPAVQGDLSGTLDRFETQTTEDLDALRRRRAGLDGRIDAIQTAIAELDEVTTGKCPVCRRPLSADEVAEAKADHLRELAGMRDELAHLDETATLAKLQSIRGYQRRSRELAAPTRQPASPAGTSEDAAATHTAAQQAMEAATQQLIERRAAVMSSEAALQSAESDQHSSQLLAADYRRIALVSTARAAIQSTIRTLLDQTIDPLEREVAGRWKRLFAERGSLVMDGQGILSRDVNGETLPYGSFSTGEKMGAQLLLRLMVLDAATNASFCWIDEPLEHLDPDARRHLASLLARTPSISGVRQVLVTTYEEPLARRLAEHGAGDVRLVYVRPGEGEGAD